MKNVQYYLNELNKNLLTKKYYSFVNNNIFEYENPDISIKEYEENYKNKILEFINHLANLDISNTPPFGIFFAYNKFTIEENESISTNIAVEFVFPKELKENNIIDYHYEFISEKDCMSSFIADTKYTQNHIYSTIANILYNISMYGFDEKSKQKQKEKYKLESTLQNSDTDNNNINANNSLSRPPIQLIINNIKNNKQLILKDKIYHDICEYNMYSRKIELDKLISNVK